MNHFNCHIMRSTFRRPRNTSLHENQVQSFFSNRTPFFQAKGLSIGQSGDKYEQEANKMADAVVNGSSSAPTINKKEISSIQREALATPLEDEKLGTAEQRMEKDKLVQEKPEASVGEKEMEEAAIQTKGEKEEEEPMRVQPKPESDSGSVAGPSLSAQLESSKGKGKPLHPETRMEMESAFGVNFSGVKIHTDREAAQMNKGLHARAFTNGKDIYFNSGKFNPGTSAGKHLLAHELTHVVQQSNEPTANIQKNELQKPCPSRLGPDDPVPQGWQEYHGDPSWFHCGFRGILEDRTPTPEEPQNECFYDHDGNLVDENHEYAGCRGTPNQYDSSSNWFKHTFFDTGGIWHRGREAYEESRRYEEQEGNPIQAQKDCVKRLGGCPETRPAGIPTPEDIRQYNEQCRQETRYRGNDVTPDCGS